MELELLTTKYVNINHIAFYFILSHSTLSLTATLKSHQATSKTYDRLVFSEIPIINKHFN